MCSLRRFSLALAVSSNSSNEESKLLLNEIKKAIIRRMIIFIFLMFINRDFKYYTSSESMGISDILYMRVYYTFITIQLIFSAFISDLIQIVT